MRGKSKIPTQRGGNEPKFRKYAAFAKKFRDIIGLLESCPSGEDLPVTAIRWKYVEALAKRRQEANPTHSRNFENWWRGESIPAHLDDLIEILRTNGANEPALNEMKEAAAKGAPSPVSRQQDDSSHLEERPRRPRTRPISRPKRRRLAEFSIDAPGQGHSKEDLDVYFDYIGGREPIEGGLGWISAKRVDINFSADHYTPSKRLDLPGLKADAGVWIITPKPGEPCIHGPLFEAGADTPPLVHLVSDPEVADPKPPSIRVFIPNMEFLHFEPAGPVAEATKACAAAIAAFLKVVDGDIDATFGINLGSATFQWEDK